MTIAHTRTYIHTSIHGRGDDDEYDKTMSKPVLSYVCMYYGGKDQGDIICIIKKKPKFGDVNDGKQEGARGRAPSWTEKESDIGECWLGHRRLRIGGWGSEDQGGTGETSVADLSPRPRHLCRGKAHSRTPTYSAFVRSLAQPTKHPLQFERHEFAGWIIRGRSTKKGKHSREAIEAIRERALTAGFSLKE